jgi:hypothetical protein
MGDTHGHYSKRYLVVSDTQPNNPIDGLLWYNPDLCLTTTTTTGEPVTTTTTTTIAPTTTTTTTLI